MKRGYGEKHGKQKKRSSMAAAMAWQNRLRRQSSQAIGSEAAASKIGGESFVSSGENIEEA
jgi:hypothetical protein